MGVREETITIFVVSRTDISDGPLTKRWEHSRHTVRADALCLKGVFGGVLRGLQPVQGAGFILVCVTISGCLLGVQDTISDGLLTRRPRYSMG